MGRVSRGKAVGVRPLNSVVRAHMIAIQTRRDLAAFAVILAAFVSLSFGIGAAFPWEHKGVVGSAVHWGIVLLIGIPMAIAVQALGTWILSRPFVERLPSPARIALVTAGSLAAIAIAAAVTIAVREYAL